MSLGFPNQARHFDTSKSRVCFWGYDEIMEVSFFIDMSAIKKLCPDIRESKSDILDAFDASLDHIYAAAERAYNRGKKGTYVYALDAADF